MGGRLSRHQQVRPEDRTEYPIVHDPANPNSFGSHSVSSIGADSRGHLWFGTMDDGLDRFDPATETFTHYRNDSAGRYVGWVRRVIEDREGEIWFVGDRASSTSISRPGRWRVLPPPSTA